jgi:4-methyl-5(b-hydroxyethyl)-thiazole monophosphate biosynthesis
MTRALVPLADGAEEMEAVIIIDTLRRAGWHVACVGIRKGPVVASRGVRLVPDAVWSEVDPDSFDVLVLPGGGGGTEQLLGHSGLLDALRRFHDRGSITAAVCAGPLVLQGAGLLDGRRATCHPGVAGRLTVTERLDEPVVVDGTVVTSQGPGTSFLFALTLIAMVDGKEEARKIASAMIVDFP